MIDDKEKSKRENAVLYYLEATRDMKCNADKHDIKKTLCSELGITISNFDKIQFEINKLKQ